MRQIIKYPGSKMRMAKTIIDLIPKHDCYVEVFGGTGAVLINKKPSSVEVYNDISDDLTTLFRVARDNSEELMRLLQLTPYGRTEYVDAITRLSQRDYDNEIEHARMTFVAFNQSFAGRGREEGNFVYSKNDNKAADFRSHTKAIGRLSERLQNVVIEKKRCNQLIRKLDGKTTCFYLDPPYVDETLCQTDLYENRMFLHEHKELVSLLKTIEGSAIVSGYDHPIYNSLELHGWGRIEVEIRIIMDVGIDQDRTEVLWASPGCKKPRAEQQELFDMTRAHAR